MIWLFSVTTFQQIELHALRTYESSNSGYFAHKPKLNTNLIRFTLSYRSNPLKMKRNFVNSIN